ncbi:50S ribosomal protein L25 [Corynebacterium phocae]|uniref:Large ribosomal subunit protein bL25 n=1 Tax=Corynebacterium phocae TaxID=161895 RepID=A0A1L7D471_9CORY|nr:50S ribosomal protein L25/general stress protein Ctc [Corynebacterium phocae]APT92934.1 50S ribosomal protein L25 [Corynebacterium phocae]KAA8723267.1 50S ribosomal protein L25/general stress protein Ctc [Corynebacterium phocae]
MANETPVLKAQTRKEFGKGPSRRLRAAGRVPAVTYGHGIDPLHFSVDRLEATALIRNFGVNAVFELDLEGEKHLSMVKNIDQNVLTLNIDHLDFQYIKRGEKVEVEVPLVVEGETEPGTQSLQVLDVVLVEAGVLNIPEEITISVEGLADGDSVTAADITMPEDVTLLTDEETTLVTVAIPEVDEELEAAAEAAEEGGAEAGAESTEEESEEETKEDSEDEE